MSCKKDKFEKRESLKVRNLCAKNLCAKNITAENTTTENLAVNAIILNGTDITCELSGPAVEDRNLALDLVDKEGRPLRNPQINGAVFNSLLCNAQLELVASQERIAEGRALIQQFESENSCSQCGYTGGVPMSIYGYITRPLLTVRQCGFTGGTGPTAPRKNTEVVQRMSYNLEVDYDVTVAKSTQARVCTVLCQLAYMDPNDKTGFTGPTGPCSGPTGNCGLPICSPVFVEEIVIGNKQFYPTLDVLYGEMFSGDVYIDSSLAELAATAMPDPNNSAAIQLVFFVEEGLSIWSEENSRGDGAPPLAKDTPGNAAYVRFQDPRCPTGKVACVDNTIYKDVGCIDIVVPAFTFAIVPSLPYLTVQFTNGTTGDNRGPIPEPIRYEWKFGDGSTSTDVNPSHTYKDKGTYNVLLSAEYFNGGAISCFGKEYTSQAVEVSGTPPLLFQKKK
jgi:hypothetical protein